VTPDGNGQREWMREQLRIASEHFSVQPEGEPVFGWHDRTIGSRVASSQGERWLRVSWADPQWVRGEYWTGNNDAKYIKTVPKPTVLDLYDWGAENYRNRAELLTLVTDQPCSTSQDLRNEVALPDRWWADLRHSLDELAKNPTERGGRDQDMVTNRLLAFFGSSVDPTVTAWVTAHGDLNWTNITCPNLYLLDWESWGVKMVGYDAATLYVLSLRAPETSRNVHDTFADILDSPDGIRAQLYVIARYLKRVEVGDFADYADLLHQHARRLTDGM
jgi:hypothetical protein